MKVLVDTHVFLWFVNGSSELSKNAREIIEKKENQLFISVASLWEISIKYGLGKLHISGGFSTVIDDVLVNGFEILPIDYKHLILLSELPFHHRDPFDRLIAVQAICENIDLLSKDQIFDDYLKEAVITRIF